MREPLPLVGGDKAIANLCTEAKRGEQLLVGCPDWAQDQRNGELSNKIRRSSKNLRLASTWLKASS